jgi:ketosteroid isomerase-like protein
MEGQNAALEDIEIDQSDVRVHVFPGGDNAWATSLWQFKASAGEDQLNLPVRCTWELERREGTWRVVHFHKSIAAG